MPITGVLMCVFLKRPQVRCVPVSYKVTPWFKLFWLMSMKLITRPVHYSASRKVLLIQWKITRIKHTASVSLNPVIWLITLHWNQHSQNSEWFQCVCLFVSQWNREPKPYTTHSSHQSNTEESESDVRSAPTNGRDEDYRIYIQSFLLQIKFSLNMS